MIIEDLPGDRIITELYAWIATDKRTGLEGLCGMTAPDGTEMQAATSSPATARTMGEIIRALPYMGRTFRLVRFTKAGVVEEIK